MTTIPVTSNSRLHSGKWTHEECLYVTELIKEFEAGSLNIEDNISLRRFLSKALNCSPKRISKKFEGSAYNGKQLYKRKASTLTAKEIEARRNKLRELEHKYQDSLRVLKMVETSCKSMPVAHRNGLTAQSQAPLLRTGRVVLCNSSRDARIAQLKADIALGSVALQSKASVATEVPQRKSLQLLEPTTQSQILTALSQSRSLSCQFRPTPSQEASQSLRAHVALNQLLLRGSATTTTSVAQALPVDIAFVRSTDPIRQRMVESLKRGLESTQTTSTAHPVYKRFKLY